MTEVIKFLNSFAVGESSWPARDFVFLCMLVANVWLALRLGRNHLRHVDEKIERNKALLATLEAQGRSHAAALSEISDRLARIEGRIQGWTLK